MNQFSLLISEKRLRIPFRTFTYRLNNQTHKRYTPSDSHMITLVNLQVPRIFWGFGIEPH